MKKSFLAVVLSAGLVPSWGAAAERPAEIRGIRPLGMGDAFTALADDQNVFFYNPAGTVMRSAGMVNILTLSASGNTDLKDAYDFVDTNEKKLTDFDDLPMQERINLVNEINNTVGKLEPYIQASLLNLSFLSGPMGGRFHWGFGAFTQTEGSFRIGTDFAVPELSYDLNADVVAPLNLAFRLGQIWRLPGKWGVGANLKYMRRGQMNQQRISTVELEDIEVPEPQKSSGIGADVGLLYQPTQRWNVGLAALDVGGTKLDFDALEAKDGFDAKPAREAGIKTRWNLGFAWTPGKIGVSRLAIPTNDRLQLAFDIKDIANADNKVFFDDGFIADTAWKHMHLGAQYAFWFLRLRAGANQGYPTFGLGLDWPLIKLDYAYYGEELGETAGTRERKVHRVALSFGFGYGKTEARDRIANAKKGGSAAPAREAKSASNMKPTSAPVPVEADDAPTAQ